MEEEGGCCVSEIFVWILRKFFRALGKSIGQRPKLYCAVTTAVCLILCSGFLKAELDNNVRDGYTPLDAPSRKEQEAFVKFFNNEPYISYIQVRAVDGGSLLRLDHLNSTVELLDYLADDFKVKFKDEFKVMSQVCHPFCEENEVIRKFYFALKAKTEDRYSNESQIGVSSKLDYPVSTIFNRDFFLGEHFYGIEMKTRQNETNWDEFTSISKVELIVFRFRNMKLSQINREFLNRWDDAVFDFSKTFHHPLINMSVMSQGAISKEVVRAGVTTIPYFPPGIGMMIVFAVGSVALSAWLNPRVTLKNSKPLVTILGVICPVMATGAALGLVFLIGFKANSVLSVVPFLVLAIGVDDAFLMIHAWQRTAPEMPIPERMAEILANVGPSVSITSITNSVAFAVGALTPTPAVRLLCVATSIAMFADLICELTFFGAVLADSGRKEVVIAEDSKNHEDSENSSDTSDTDSKKPKRNVRKKLKSMLDSFLDKYCSFVSSWPAVIVVLLFFAGYWSFSILGVNKMKVELSCLKLWLKDSPMFPAMVAKHHIMWEDYNYVLVLVNQPPDFADFNQSLAFTEMVERFEDAERAVGRASTRIWIPDYKKFTKLTTGNIWGDYDYYEDIEEESSSQLLGDFDTKDLAVFFQIADYEHWNSTVFWSDDDGIPRIQRFAFMTAYLNCSTWAIRARLMLKWREIGRQFPQFQISVWETDGFFSDQILTLKGVTLKTVAITMCSMAAICFLFIPNLWCVLVASVSTASISFGVYGVLSWWGIDLDPISMVSLIMSIGFSVDYTAHISYHYCQHRALATKTGAEVQSRVETMKHTLIDVGYPMIQAGVSTMIAVSPLSWVECYMADVFVKTVFLVSLCGMLHGLFIVPVVLANFPDSVNKMLTPSCVRGNFVKKYWRKSGSCPSSSIQTHSPTNSLKQKAPVRRFVSSNKVIPASVDCDMNTNKTVVRIPDENPD